MKKVKDSEFGARLREAFGGANNTQIAGRMGVSNSVLTKYMSGESYPTPDALIKISRLVECSIHWLLTGEGSRHVELDDGEDFEPPPSLDEVQRQFIETVAKYEERSYEDVLREVVALGMRDAARARAERVGELEPRDLEDILGVFYRNFSKVDASGLRRARLRR